jgi:hypothetical protein
MKTKELVIEAGRSEHCTYLAKKSPKSLSGLPFTSI